MYKFSKAQSGLTLLELSLAIGVISLIVAASIAGYIAVQSGQRAVQSHQELLSVRDKMKQLYASAGNFGGTDSSPVDQNSIFITASYLPATLVISGSDILNSYGGNMNIMGGKTFFYVKVTEIPTAVCVDLMTDAIPSGWRAVQVGGTAPTSKPSQMSAVSAATAANSSNCSSADAVTMYFSAV